MPQIQLPIFPSGMTMITPELGAESREGKVTYFVGCMPVFQHDEDDVRTFRMITSQMVVGGHVRQVDIVRAFGVSAVSVKRSVKRYVEKGAAGFFEPKRTRGPAVLTPKVVQELEDLMDTGLSSADAARKLGLLPNTVAKAIRTGRVRAKKKKESADKNDDEASG